MAVPIKLNFQPSQRRKEQQLSNNNTIDLTRQSIIPGRHHEAHPRSFNYTNPDPSVSSPTRTASVLHSRSIETGADMAASLLPPDPNGRPKHFRNLLEECIFVFAIMMATSATTFVQGVIVINTATIGNDLKMTSAQITWIAAAIGLASGSFMLFFGKTADLFGSKIQLVTGMAFLSLFSLITFFAPNPMAMNILCGFLGLGTAVISPPAIGILFAAYPEGRRRNRATGALGAGNPIGFILGSVSSGVATKVYSWRASFIVVAVFFFIMALFAFWTMPQMPRSRGMRSATKQFDWLGTILTIMGMALFCAALTEGPIRGWSSRSVIVMLVIGFLLLLSFTMWEKIYKFPLLNPSVWNNRNYTLCVLCTFFGYMSFITNSFWIALYMQKVQHMSSLLIAARLLPQAVAGILWSYIGGALVSRISGTIIMGIGALAYLMGATLQIFIRQDTSYWKLLFPALMITVIGADFQFIVSNLYVSKQMPSQASLAAGVIQTVMRLSVSLGLSITAAVYGSSLQTPEAQRDVTFAFDRAFLCSILFAMIGVLFVPFMRIEMQGERAKPEKEKLRVEYHDGVCDEEPQTSTGEYRDFESQTGAQGTVRSWTRSQTSLSTQATEATCGSDRSYFPRWSWEGENAWKDQRYQDMGGDGHVIYEVCVKCLEERRVTVGDYGGTEPSSRSTLRSSGVGYEPTAVRGGGLDTTDERTYEMRFSMPRATAMRNGEFGAGGWV